MSQENVEAEVMSTMDERMRWVEQAIEETREWSRLTGGEAFVDIMFSRPGDDERGEDYAAATDQRIAAKNAAATLKALEAERDWLATGPSFRRDP